MTRLAGIPEFGEQAYAGFMIDEDAIRYRWDTVGRELDERGRRLFAAAEVRTDGWGGLAIVSRITGLARSTINRGEDDLDAEPLTKDKVRRAGGGRRAIAEVDPGLLPELARLVETATLGDPVRPLIWVCQEHGQTCSNADGDGPSDQRRHRAQGTGQTWLFTPVQSEV